MDPMRVFVCYAHEDSDAVKRILEVVKDESMVFLYDEGLHAGDHFDQRLQQFIQYAHVVLAFVSRASRKSAYASQEIGFALALKVPVIPLSLDGKVPDDMLMGYQAPVVRPDAQTGEEIRRKLTAVALDDPHNFRALYELGVESEDRAKLMAGYANQVRELQSLNLSEDLTRTGMLRQRGGMSVFCIPDIEPPHAEWEKRYDRPRDLFHCQRQYKERMALGAHARQSGCRLMLELVPVTTFRPASQLARVRVLIRSLLRLPPETTQVTIAEVDHYGDDLTLLGDWFAAQTGAVTTDAGHRRTAFTTHALTVRSMVQTFDRRFEQELDDLGWTPETSLARALEVLRAREQALVAAMEGATAR